MHTEQIPQEISKLQPKPSLHLDQRLTCGQCKWFHVGYQGVTCVKTRGVQTKEHACVEFENYKPSVFDPLMKDKYIREVVSKAKAYKDVWLVQQMNMVKGIRLFKGERKDVPYIEYASEEKLVNIAKTFETISSHQEKLLELQDLLKESLNDLQSQMKDVQAYLLSHYQELFKNMKNDSERAAMLRLAVPEIYKAIEKTEGVLDRVQATDAYLKNLHFSTVATQASAHKVWEYRMMYMAGRNRQNG